MAKNGSEEHKMGDPMRVKSNSDGSSQQLYQSKDSSMSRQSKKPVPFNEYKFGVAEDINEEVDD